MMVNLALIALQLLFVNILLILFLCDRRHMVIIRPLNVVLSLHKFLDLRHPLDLMFDLFQTVYSVGLSLVANRDIGHQLVLDESYFLVHAGLLLEGLVHHLVVARELLAHLDH